MGKDVRFKAPDGAGDDACGSTVEVASPEIADDAAKPTEGDAGPAGGHKKKKRSLAVGGDEVLTHSEFRPSAQPRVQAAPILFIPDGHRRQRSNHLYQRRVDAVDVESAELPVAQTSDKMAGFVQRWAVDIGAISK